MNSKIKSFTDLNAWKEAHLLLLETYIITKTFPMDEQFGLTNQIRRAAVSITSNIAEGFSRSSYKKIPILFYGVRLVNRSSESAFNCKRCRVSI